jgi:hypothetical protein
MGAVSQSFKLGRADSLEKIEWRKGGCASISYSRLWIFLLLSWEVEVLVLIP